MKWLALAALVSTLVGCQSSEPEATKGDFVKKPMPAGYHGPEGAPPTATPPANAGGK